MVRAKGCNWGGVRSALARIFLSGFWLKTSCQTTRKKKAKNADAGDSPSAMCCCFFWCFGQQNVTGLAVGRCWKGMGFLEGFWVETYGDFCLEIWLEWYGNIVWVSKIPIDFKHPPPNKHELANHCNVFCFAMKQLISHLFSFERHSFPLLGTQIRCRCGCFETFHFSMGCFPGAIPVV